MNIAKINLIGHAVRHLYDDAFTHIRGRPSVLTARTTDTGSL